VITSSNITCPFCKFASTENMPLNACQVRYECKKCGQILKSIEGDCCVFCSYGDAPCPPIQVDG
jgi:hypothetical protein